MTLKEAYELRRHECLALQRENNKLTDAVAKLRKGVYSDPDKISHIKQIGALSRELNDKKKIIGRYQVLYEAEQKKVADLSYENAVLEEKNRMLQWQIDCLNGTSSDESRTAKEEADAKIKALSDEVARLTALLNRDGTNTGTPTSKTPIGKKKVIPNSREKSNRPKGGQPGHQKHSMAPFAEEELTETIPHELDACPDCGGSLTELREIPKDELDYEVKVVKKRHLFKEYICDNCGKMFRTKDSALKAENQYGASVQATALSLMNLGFVSISRTREFLCGIDPASVSVSEGYLAKLQKRYSDKLTAFVEDVRIACIGSPLLYWDDTVVFINASRACMRFYGNEHIALYTAHMKKDLKGILADNVLPRLPASATVMHDHNTINYRDEFLFRNVECLQHLERDLQKLIDISHHKWAASLKKLIQSTIHKRKQWIAAGKESFGEMERRTFMSQYNGLLESGYKEYFKDLNSYYSQEENALLNRLEKYRENYTEWIRDFSVPTTNNLSERSLRFVKCKDKISGQFQNEEHAQYFANLRTYIETCSRNGVNPFQAILRLTQNNPYTFRELCTACGN